MDEHELHDQIKALTTVVEKLTTLYEHLSQQVAALSDAQDGLARKIGEAARQLAAEVSN